jgi:hypothetical protein
MVPPRSGQFQSLRAVPSFAGARHGQCIRRPCLRGEAVMVTGWRRPAWSVPYQVRRAQEHPERGMNWKVWRSVMATVLVVEDEGKLRELVRSYLERAGFSVLSTGSGPRRSPWRPRPRRTWWSCI